MDLEGGFMPTDTQVYVIVKPIEHAALIPKLEQCIVDIKVVHGQ